MKNYLRHRVIDNGVHEFLFYRNDHQAVDFFYGTIGQVFEFAPKDKMVRYIVDWSQISAPSMNYMYMKVHEWGRKHPGVAPGRGVVIYNQRGFAAIGNALAKILMQLWGDKIQLRFVHAEKRDEAMAWLLSDGKPASAG